MSKMSLACAVLALGAACTGANKTCPSDELRPDQRAGQVREGEEGTAETVIPGDPSQEQTIILIPVPESEMPEEGEQLDVLPEPGAPQGEAAPQAPTIFLIPIEPDGAHPDMPENGGGLQEDIVPDAQGDVTSETLVPRETPEQEPAPPTPDPKDIYF